MNLNYYIEYCIQCAVYNIPRKLKASKKTCSNQAKTNLEKLN